MNGFFDTFEDFVKSKSFEKIVFLLPRISQAKNLEEVLAVSLSQLSAFLWLEWNFNICQILTKEAESNWDTFFNNIHNEDYKTQVIDTFSSTIIEVRLSIDCLFL